MHLKLIIDIPNKRSLLINYFIKYIYKKNIGSTIYGFRHALWNKIKTEDDFKEIENIKKIIEQNFDLNKLVLSSRREYSLYKKIGYGNNDYSYLGNIRFSHEWIKIKSISSIKK